MDPRRFYGLWLKDGQVASACYMNEDTGVWHEDFQAACQVWGLPLTGRVLVRVEEAYGQARDALALLPGTYEGLMMPYVVVVAMALKAAGYGRLVPASAEEYLTFPVLAIWQNLKATRPFRSAAAAVIQKHWRRWRRLFLARLEVLRRQLAARRIQRACHNWILKPRTADGLEGINVRLLGGMLPGIFWMSAFH